MADSKGATSPKSWLFPLLVISSAVIPYAALPGFQFVFDDRTQILNNPTLLRLDSIPQYFIHHLWSYIPQAAPRYFRPLFSTWLNLNHALFGFNPAGWHVTLLGLHALASYLTYCVVGKVFQNRTTGFLAALLFAVHPVHVEAVAWISGGNDPLAAIFVMGSFLIYRKGLSFEGRHRLLLIALSVALYACALLSKESVLLFPALILLDALQTGRRRTADLALALPYFLMGAGYCLFRIEVLGSFGETTTPLSPATFLLTLPSVLLSYLRLLFFPVALSPFYDSPYVDHADWRHFWMPIIVLGAVAALTIAGIRRLSAQSDEGTYNQRGCLFFLLWTAIFLVPALDLNVLDFGEIAHDRYLYLPSVGFCAILALFLKWLASKLTIPNRTKAVATAGLTLLLATATAAQSYYWKSDFVLYRRGASVAPLNTHAQNNLANAYLDAGNFAQGIALHQKILENDPGRPESYHSIGMAYYVQNDFAQAQRYFQKAVSLRPSPDWYFQLGLAQFKGGDIDAAEKSFKEALRGGPNRSEFHAALGAVQERQGKLALALQEYETAAQLNPDSQALRANVNRIKQQLHP